MAAVEDLDRKYAKYLNILENKITKRNELTSAQLMDIVFLAQNSDERMAMMTDRNKSILIRLIRNRLSEFSTEDLMTIFAFGGNQAAVLMSDWEREMVDRLEPDQLLPILQVYIDMKMDLPRQLFERWEMMAGKSQVVKQWSVDDTAIVMQRMAFLHLRPNNAFVKRWVDRFEHHLPKFSAHQLALIIESMGKLRINDGVFGKAIMELIADWETNQMHKMSASDLVITMKGLAKLDLNPQKANESFVTFWFDEVGGKLKRLDAYAVVAIGSHLGKLKVDPPTDPQFVDRWVGVVETNMSTFGAGELAMALDGCLYFGVVGPAITFIDAWINSAESVMEIFFAQELAGLLIKLHQLKILPDERFFSRWMSACERLIDDMYVKNYVDMMAGLASYQRQPTKSFLLEWNSQARRKITRLAPSSATKLEHAFAELQLEMDHDVAKVVQKALK